MQAGVADEIKLPISDHKQCISFGYEITRITENKHVSIGAEMFKHTFSEKKKICTILQGDKILRVVNFAECRFWTKPQKSAKFNRFNCSKVLKIEKLDLPIFLIKAKLNPHNI